MSFAQFARSLSNAELAASLEFNAYYNRSETAKAVMHEAARRLRGEPEMVPAEVSTRGALPLANLTSCGCRTGDRPQRASGHGLA